MLRSFFDKLFQKKPVLPNKGYLIFGLGNPGHQYQITRHNAGFLVLDALEKRIRKTKQGSKFHSDYVSGTLPSGEEVVLIKPLTFMNRSGDSVRAWAQYYGKSSSELLIVVDDFNIPFGTLRFRQNGSAGGHNGLKSIISQVGAEFPRLRVGIGPLPQNTTVIDFVLGNFTDDELSRISGIADQSVSGIVEFIRNGIVSAMSRYNG